jgi:hypothetical protein
MSRMGRVASKTSRSCDGDLAQEDEALDVVDQIGHSNLDRRSGDPVIRGFYRIYDDRKSRRHIAGNCSFERLAAPADFICWQSGPQNQTTRLSRPTHGLASFVSLKRVVLDFQDLPMQRLLKP